MNDMYVMKGGMTKEQMFRLRLINGFNFAPIVADAVVDLSKDFFQNDSSGVCNGQILYLAISNEEGPGKSIFDSKHVEVVLTLDSPEDMDVYEKFGLSAYRQHVLLRIAQEARDQNALLTIKDLVKLLKSSYSTIKRNLKYFREREIYVPLRGIIKDIGPSSGRVLYSLTLFYKVLDLFFTICCWNRLPHYRIKNQCWKRIPLLSMGFSESHLDIIF